MNSRFVASCVFGAMFPLSYFLLVRVGPIRTIDDSGSQTTGASGIAGFIEFYGLGDALVFYAIAFTISSIVAFFLLWFFRLLKTTGR